MKKMYLMLVCAILSQLMLAQNLKLKLDKQAKIVKMDNVKSIYTIDEDNVLTKYNQLGEKTGNFSNQSYGDITKFDVSNPMLIFIYYANVNKAILLDSNLSKVGEINFDNFIGISVGGLVAAADKSGIFILDKNSSNLYKFNTSGQSLGKFGNVPMSKAIGMIQDGNKIYLQGEQKFVVADLVEMSNKEFPLGEFSLIDCYQKKIIGFKEEQFIEIGAETGETRPLFLPATWESSDNVFVSKNTLFIQHSNNDLLVYNIQVKETPNKEDK